MRNKPSQPRNFRLAFAVCLLLFLTGCGEASSDIDRATKAAELAKEAYDRQAKEDLDYWNILEEIDDFGDRSVLLSSFSENGVGPSKSAPYGDALQLMATCQGKDSTADGKFYITVAVLKYADLQVIGSAKSADIRFDGGNPTNIPVYVRGSRVVHLEEASRYISKILDASTFSVRFEAQDKTYRGTFRVQGFSKYLSNFKSAGCSL